MDTEATAVISGVGEAWVFSISNKLIPTLPHRAAVLASSRALAATTGSLIQDFLQRAIITKL